MRVLLDVIAVAACLWLLSRAVGDVRGRSWAGPRTAGMRARAGDPVPPLSGPGAPGTPRAGRVRSAFTAAFRPDRHHVRVQAQAEIDKTWARAQAQDWLRQRDHERRNGPPQAPGQPAAAPEPARARRRVSWRSVRYLGAGALAAASLRLLRRDRDSPDPDAVAEDPPAEPVLTPEARERLRRNLAEDARRQGRTAPPLAIPASQPTANGGTAVTNVPSAEQLVDAIQRIYAAAAAGNINDKRAALLAMHEADTRFAAMKQMVARMMSEPGMNYGPEITEPVARSADHSHAAAMSTSEAIAALATLMSMQLGDFPGSGRQAPHHDELTETGAR